MSRAFRALAFLCAVLCFGGACSSTRVTSWQGDETFQGKGGSARRVNGIDIWDIGEPNCEYRVLGVIRRDNYNISTGVAIMNALMHESGVVTIARRLGADAVVLVSQAQRIGGLDSDGYIRTTDQSAYYAIQYVRQQQRMAAPAVIEDEMAAYHAAFQKNDRLGLVTAGKALADKYPTEAWAQLHAANAYLFTGFNDEAIRAYRQVLQIEPENPVGWLGLAQAYRQSGLIGNSVAAFRKAVELNPNEPEVLYHLAFAYRGVKQEAEAQQTFQRAIASYKRATSVQAGNIQLWLRLARCYGETAQFPQAISACQEALKIKPDLAEAWLGLAIVYQENKQSTEAETAYAKAYTLKPELRSFQFSRDQP